MTSKTRRPALVSGPQKAFTLAEVLITLAIIGVVAALTIPTVVRNYKEKQTVVQLKKAYSQLNSAFQMAVIDNGTPENWNWGTSSHASGANYVMQTYFVPYLKIIENCNGTKGCFPDIPTYFYNKSGTYDNFSSSLNGKLKLADGTLIRTETFGGCSFNRSKGGKKPLNSVCGLFIVDINGNKPPSIMGVDVFFFYITKYGIYPYGMKDDKVFSVATHCSGPSTGLGYSCAAWVLGRENMDYLHRNVAAEW